MKIILLFIWMPIALDADIKSVNDVRAYFEQGEKADCKKCFFAKADNILAKASLDEKHIIIIEYFLESDNKFIRQYLKEKILKRSGDKMSLSWFLFALQEKHHFEDIPFFCHLLINPFRVEGGITSDIALEYLRFSIPIEYDINYKEFVQSKKYRVEIANRYMKWYESIRTPIRWDPQFRMFFPENHDPGMGEKHFLWILDTSGAGLDSYRFWKLK
jgi:hypothetical protein